MAVHECECWVCVDADGNYATGTSDEEAREAYESSHMGLSECAGFRLVKVALRVPVSVQEVCLDVPELPEASARAV